MGLSVSPYWFDPVSGSYMKATQVQPWPLYEIIPVGYRATVADPLGGQNATCEIWALPITLISTGVIPMRHTQRDDGYGIDERHGRIRKMKSDAASSTEATTRIFNTGSNTYR